MEDLNQKKIDFFLEDLTFCKEKMMQQQNELLKINHLIITSIKKNKKHCTENCTYCSLTDICYDESSNKTKN